MTDKKVKVTVIIPVYNAEDFLTDTLQDAIGQTLPEIEILCVDDGSTDHSAQIIQQFAQKDARVKLLQQKNQHAGAARNNGIEHASGEYLAFWDADDRFSSDMLEKLYNKITALDADVCVCKANRFDVPTGDLIRSEMYLLEKYLQGAEYYSKETCPEYLFNVATNVPWNKLFRRTFVQEHGLRFENRARANDVYFVMMAFYHAAKIAVVRERLVTYRVNNRTSLTGTQAESPFCAMDAFAEVQKKLEALGGLDDSRIRQSFENRVLQSLLYTLHQSLDGQTFEQIYECLRREGFQKFRITDREDYYYSEDAYRNYQRIMKLQPLDYALLHAADEKKKQQEHIRDLKKENGRIKKELEYRAKVINHPIRWLAQKEYMRRKAKNREENR